MKRKLGATVRNKNFEEDEIASSSDSDFEEDENTLFNANDEISALELSKNEKTVFNKEHKVPRMDNLAAEFIDEKELSMDERRVAIAKKYLSQIKEFEEENAGDDALLQYNRKDKMDPIVQRLHREALKSQKRIPNNLARKFAAVSQDVNKCHTVFYKGHKKSPTCLSVAQDYTRAVSGAKDCCLIHWDLATGKKLLIIRGNKNKTINNVKNHHTDEILACAICPADNNLVASAGRDKLIKLWDMRKDPASGPIGDLTGHFDAITGLCFQLGTHTLFSCSLDRTLKVWDCAEQSFVETLYGHEAAVLACDSLHSYRVLSSSSDHTLRLWKVEEETQLIFKSHNQNIDCVKMLRENVYLSAGQNGNIHVFNRTKRKPLYTYTNTGSSIDKTYAKNLGWISSLCAVQYSDMFIAGSDYGHIDFYSMDSGFIKRVAIPNNTTTREIEYKGWINAMCADFDKQTQQLTIVGLNGTEHRMGRWGAQKGVRNGLWLMKWDLSLEGSDNHDNTEQDTTNETEQEDA